MMPQEIPEKTKVQISIKEGAIVEPEAETEAAVAFSGQIFGVRKPATENQDFIPGFFEGACGPLNALIGIEIGRNADNDPLCHAANLAGLELWKTGMGKVL